MTAGKAEVSRVEMGLGPPVKHVTLSAFKTPIVFERGVGNDPPARKPGSLELSVGIGRWRIAALGGHAGVPRGCPEEAVRPLLGELSGTGEDDRDLGISHRQPGQHVGEPGAATRLSPKQVGLLSLDNDGGAPLFRQLLHLERLAAVR